MSVNPEWHESVSCKPHPQTWWFPEHGGDHSYDKARPICQQCSVRPQCLAHALNQPEKFGMWGGYDTKQRSRMPRKKKPSWTVVWRGDAA